jgi:hypothetical protein
MTRLAVFVVIAAAGLLAGIALGMIDAAGAERGEMPTPERNPQRPLIEFVPMPAVAPVCLVTGEPLSSSLSWRAVILLGATEQACIFAAAGTRRVG